MPDERGAPLQRVSEGAVSTTRDHWWWRPGWGPHTRYLTWHVTVEHQLDVHRLAGAYGRALAPVAALLPPVAQPGLHVTLSGVGHREDLPAPDLQAVVDAVRARLAGFARVAAPLGRAVAGREAVVLPLGAADELVRLRDELRGGAADALGPARVVDTSPEPRPHISVAYATGEVPLRSVKALLDEVEHEPTDLTVRDVSLILLRREHRQYRWETVVRVPLGP